MDPGTQRIEIVTQIALVEFKRNVERIDDLFKLLPDWKLSRKTTMACDCGLYIPGHLTSRLDILLKSLGVSRQRFHELEEIFASGSIHSDITQLSASTLRDSWSDIRKISMFELNLGLVRISC
jgi:hypothetical protein